MLCGSFWISSNASFFSKGLSYFHHTKSFVSGKSFWINSISWSSNNPSITILSKGSFDLLDQIKGHVHDLGLKGKVRVNKAGCLDACAQGPTMVVYPDSIWYAPRTRQDMEEILTQHIQNDQPVQRLILPFNKNKPDKKP